MSELPDPLVTADVDLKGFPGFVLDVEALLASELVALATAEELAAALMLWCRAWQQTPHGSLPNDERILAAFSKAKNWKKVREMAMRGFVLCSDGRFYHKTLCKWALEAWKKRVIYDTKREKDAERLREWRDKKQGGNNTGNALETRFNAETKDVRSEVKRSEVEEKHSVPDGTDGKPSNSPELPISQDAAKAMTKTELWASGKSLLQQSGMPAAQCGSFVGKLCKDYGDDIVIDAVRSTVVDRPADPASYLKAICQKAKGERKSTAPWWSTDELIIAEGQKHKLMPYPGESIHTFKGRVQAAIDGPSNAPKPSPVPATSAIEPESKRDMSPEAIAMRSNALNALKKMPIADPVESE